MHTADIFITLALASQALAIDGIKLSLSSSVTETLLGQPLMVSLDVQNDSAKPIVVCEGRDYTPVVVRDFQGALLKPTPARLLLDTGTFCQEAKPGALLSVPIAVTALATASAPGEYFVSVSVPALGPTSTNTLRVTVKPNDSRALIAWTQQLASKIATEPAEERELLRALVAVPGGVAEPAVCNVLIESRSVAVPEAVDKLETTASNSAARCLLKALPLYGSYEAEYLRSALRQMSPLLSDVQVRDQIERTVGPPKN